MKTKNNIKEAVVLLIAAIMILSTAAVTANTEEEKVSFLAASESGLMHIVPESTPNLNGKTDYIAYHDGNTENAWRFTDYSDWSCAIQLTDTELSGYRDWNITEVVLSVGCNDYGFCVADYEVWISTQLEDPTNPPVVYADGTSSGTGWDTVPLDMDYEIPDTGDVYIGVTYSNYYDFPAGVDDNNYCPEGFWFYYGGWLDGSAYLGYSVWGISAGVAGGGSGAVADLDCSGTLDFVDVEPNGTVTGEITVTNDGEPGSELNWEVESFPDWGTWTFDPDSGTGLGDGDSETISVEIVAPDEEESEFTGTVVLVNSDDDTDTCEIEVSLVTPVSQSYPIIEFLAQRFPILARILELIL
jgi:hypothetical protein